MRQGSGHSPTLERETHAVLRWRAERLVAAGFDESLAAAVAGDGRFDLHAMLDLVDRGCPPTLAVRILAPLDEERCPR